MRILVTGAAGFIGSSLCEQLVLSKHEVTAVDNFSDYYDVSLKRLRVKELLSPLSLEVLNLDICDQSKVEKIIASSNPEVVIHLAAQAGVRLGVSESRKYVDSNLVGFSNVLISTIERKVPKFCMHPLQAYMEIKQKFHIANLNRICIQVVFTEAPN